jgi:cytochrome c553
MRRVTGLVLGAVLLAVFLRSDAQTIFDPHGNPVTGALRVTTTPSSRGDCVQCHLTHGDPDLAGPYPIELFAANTNAQIAFFTGGDGPCHQERPANYPLGEDDRIPTFEPDAGYFEANTGGQRQPGVQFRGRWPGEAIWSNADLTPQGRYVSPHAFDPDMPRRDLNGQGMCENCHDPHGTPNLRDVLVATYAGIGGSGSVGPPPEYGLCFTCHGQDGPPGMNLTGRRIEDYYDAGLNGESAGHQIRRNPAVAVSWPPHIQEGDMLPCYDCHNPHGSEGSGGFGPNGFLISDQRPDWYDLTDTMNDIPQVRRFCFGCHIPSDGIPGTREVEGIVMNTITDRPGHRYTSIQSCYQCHGNEYTGPRSHNVHNPRGG